MISRNQYWKQQLDVACGQYVITMVMDISILPEKARKELLDFYNYLITKYSIKKTKQKKRFQKLLADPVKVDKIIIPSRDEIHGS
ncbi:MAG: DUF2281 domain-containing protein [Candidatus Hodarchaeales archaeon]